MQDRATNCISFYSGSTKQGGTVSGTGTTSYNTSSDKRLKKYKTFKNGIEMIKKVNPVEFD